MGEEKTRNSYALSTICPYSAEVLGVAVGIRDRCSQSSGCSHGSAALSRADGVDGARAVWAELWVRSPLEGCCRRHTSWGARGTEQDWVWRARGDAFPLLKVSEGWEIGVDLGGKLSEWSIIECAGKRAGSTVEPWWIFALRLLYQFHRLYQSLSPFEWLRNSKGNTVLLSDVLHSLCLLVGTIHLIACFCQCYVWEIHLCCV